MESKPSRDSVGDYNSSESSGDRTVVATPERMDSPTEHKTIDLEKAIADQKNGLPGPVKFAEGGLKGWLTVLGA
jgi:MFS transporter, MCT family, solute carrier family 16 (monocarboxylic acid transporters), member 10